MLPFLLIHVVWVYVFQHENNSKSIGKLVRDYIENIQFEMVSAKLISLKSHDYIKRLKQTFNTAKSTHLINFCNNRVKWQEKKSHLKQ